MNAIQLRRVIMDAAEHVPFYRRHWRQVFTIADREI